MGKWLSRVIDKGESESKNYQDLPKSNTDRTDKTPCYENGWSKIFPIQGEPFWEKDGRQIQITGAELERLKSTNAGEEEKES